MDWEKIKLGFWGATGGAIVLAIVGFKWGGWVTSGTARQMAEELAKDTVVNRLTPICVAQFNQDPEKDQKLKELKKKDSWDGRKYVEKQGWATMLGEKKPDSELAEECVKQLMQISR
ncbi:MAG: hypothetical protein ACE5HC_16255 [Candidatus Binatia bacterium]